MKIQIVHTPEGQEHPYAQGPEERFPREPLAGESFVVGIVTRPVNAVRQVLVHTQLGVQPGPSVEAVRLSHWQPALEIGIGQDTLGHNAKIDYDVWQARLTAPAVGETLAYRIEADGNSGPSYEVRGEAWRLGEIAEASLSAEGIPARSWTMQVSRAARHTDTSSAEGLPSLKQVAWLTDGARARRVRLTFACEDDEAFLGLGERYNALNQRGQILDVCCYDQYKDQGKRTYIPIPFLLSSRGYGVYVENNRWMQFDLASSERDMWTLEADLGPDETLRLVWFVGNDPLEITGSFTLFTGQPVLPPLWVFGLWMSSNEWNSQARVLKEVRQSEIHGIDASVVVIEAWSDETTFYIWNDAEYAPVAGDQAFCYDDFTFPVDGKWPDPKGMIEALHKKGLRVLLWQIPVLKRIDGPHPQHDRDRATFEAVGFGVKDDDGNLYRVRPLWFRGGYLLDVTNAAALEWWFAKRAYLLDDLGIDGFKTDGGEHLWGTRTRFADGRTGGELWNLYPRLYTHAYHQFASDKRNGDAVIFSRAGFTGSQTAPAHWAGDEASTWEAFRHSILAGLSAGISGILFWGWDLAGFSGEVPSAELYLRSAAMAAFCPIMQYHSEYNRQRELCRDRTPWNIQAHTGHPEVLEIFRFFVNVRRNLMPYIWQEAQWSAKTGRPMMRAARLWYPESRDTQYFFGRDLLVCPVVEPGVSQWEVYLPPGEWHDLWTRNHYGGGRTVEIPTSVSHIPVFVRQGAKIPVCFGSRGVWGDSVSLQGEPTTLLDFTLR